MIQLIFMGVCLVLSIVTLIVCYFYALSFVKHGEHANDYIDEEAKIIYDLQLKKARREMK